MSESMTPIINSTATTLCAHTTTLIIGAGSSGLVTAKHLLSRNIPCIVLEASPKIGSSWGTRPELAHITSANAYIELDGLPIPSSWPSHLNFAEFISYLELYAKTFDIDVRTDCRVMTAVWDRVSELWVVRTEDGRVFSASELVLASGALGDKVMPDFPNQSLFKGIITHASDRPEYDSLKDKDVLIVGIGNTGLEVGMRCLDAGARVTFAVRSIPTIVPLFWGPLDLSWCSKYIFDHIPGCITDTGLSLLMLILYGWSWKSAFPPTAKQWHAVASKRIPTLDRYDFFSKLWTKQFKIADATNGIEFTSTGVKFSDGVEGKFDAVICATGYKKGGEGKWFHGEEEERRVHRVGTLMVAANPIYRAGVEGSRVAKLIASRQASVHHKSV